MRTAPETRPSIETLIACVVIVSSPLLFGGAFTWATVVIAALTTVALAIATWQTRGNEGLLVDWVLVAMGIAWLWTCVQAVPLPEGLARSLGLRSVEHADRLRGLLWAGDIPLTVSLDPGGTRLQVINGIAIIAAFVTGRLGGSRGLRPLTMAAVAAALIVGSIGIAHSVLGLDALFGTYVPRFTQPRLLTPLLNNNHLGGFMAMASILSVGLGLSTEGRARIGWFGAAGFCALLVARTLSRGAIGALLFGVVALGAWYWRRRSSPGERAAIPLGLAVATIAGALAFAGLEPALRRFETGGLDKLAVASRGFELLEGPALWLGIGRGAFSSTFVAEEGSLGRYTHPENIIVQWLTEWGIVIGSVLFISLAVALWKRLQGARDALVAGVCIAILALSLQNLVDFSLEMAGIAVVVATLLGALFLPSGTAASKLLPAAMVGTFSLILAVSGPELIDSDTQTYVDRLSIAMERDRESTFEETLRTGLALHPSEPAFALLAATYAGRLEHPDAPEWLVVAMEEAPGWSGPHLVAARWLLDRDKLDQALLEIRAAEERHPGSARVEVCEALSKAPTLETLERAAPSGEERPGFFERAVACRTPSPALRREIDDALLDMAPSWANAIVRQARRLISEGDDAGAADLLDAAIESQPDDLGLSMARIDLALRSEDPEDAEAALSAARSRGLEGRALLEAEARVQARLGDVQGMEKALAQLRGLARGNAASVARALVLEGQLHASLGQVDEALRAYAKADQADPNSPALDYAAALAAESGRRSQALRWYRALCERNPGGSACAERSRLEAQSPLP